MNERLKNLRVAIALLWPLILCAIRHPGELAVIRAGVRCMKCHPLRRYQRSTQIPLDLAGEDSARATALEEPTQ